MNKLLSANFVRLKKNKLFWLGMVLMFAFGTFTIVTNYNDHIQNGYEVSLDSLFFGYTIIIGIVSAVFCSLFIGTEHSDGTIRNKLVVGHSRSAIYLSDFIVSTVAGLLMCLSFIAAVSIFGISLLGFFKTDIKLIMAFLFVSFMMVLAFFAICTMIAMLNQNKAFAAVISIIGVFMLLFIAIYIMQRLSAPEFYDGYIFTNSLVTVNSASEKIPNPQFLEGTKRAVYQFFLDFLPTGQSLQITSMTAHNLWQMPLYSLLITIVTTVTGIFTFRKKDLK